MSGDDKPSFDPLDLEIMDCVYEAAWTALAARCPVLDATDEAERQKNLRQRIFVLAQPGRVDFDALYEKALSSYDEPRLTPLLNRTAI